MTEEPEEIATDRARGGETRGVGRYVLVGSLILVVVAFAALLIIYR